MCNWGDNMAGSAVLGRVLSGTMKDFPGGLVVRSQPSNARDAGSISGWEAKIPHASGPKKLNHKTESIL